MFLGKPESSRFLAAVQRLKQLQRLREQRTRQAKQRARENLRKLQSV